MRILLDPKEGEGTGGTTEAKTVETKTEPDKSADLVKAVEGLISRHGDPTAALRVLMGERDTLRDAVRETAAKLPPDGSKVLTAEQAKDWEHYQGLGKVADLRTALAERDSHKAENAGFRREKLVSQVAEVARIDGAKVNPKVLGKLAEKLDLVIGDLKDDKGVLIGEDGKPIAKDATPVKAAFVKGEGDALTSLAAYAKANWEEFLPSLKVAPATTTERPKGTPKIGGARHGDPTHTNQDRTTRLIPTF